MRKLVYICSPLRGNIETNTDLAREYCRDAIYYIDNVIPIAPHIYFPQFLNENISLERTMGMNMGLELLSKCDEVWVFGLTNPSEGMRAEIQYAKVRNIPIVDGFKKIQRAKEEHYARH